MNAPRTMIVFPMYIAHLMDIAALEVGVRKAWVHTRSLERIEVRRDFFSADDLQKDGPALALQCSQALTSAHCDTRRMT